MTIVASGSIAGFFREVVEDALKSQRVETDDGTTSYVVSLLADYARPAPQAEAALERPLTLLLDEALHTPRTSERFQRLRLLGDGVLYTTGFFADHFEARGVDHKYVVGIGVTAYHTASSMLTTGTPTESKHPDVFRELAEKFDGWVRVLAEVADATLARPSGDSRGLLKCYERWLKTGSSKLAEELSQHGLVPMRGAKGVQ